MGTIQIIRLVLWLIEILEVARAIHQSDWVDVGLQILAMALTWWIGHQEKRNV